MKIAVLSTKLESEQKTRPTGRNDRPSLHARFHNGPIKCGNITFRQFDNKSNPSILPTTALRPTCPVEAVKVPPCLLLSNKFTQVNSQNVLLVCQMPSTTRSVPILAVEFVQHVSVCVHLEPEAGSPVYPSKIYNYCSTGLFARTCPRVPDPCFAAPSVWVLS